MAEHLLKIWVNGSLQVASEGVPLPLRLAMPTTSPAGSRPGGLRRVGIAAAFAAIYCFGTPSVVLADDTGKANLEQFQNEYEAFRQRLDTLQTAISSTIDTIHKNTSTNAQKDETGTFRSKISSLLESLADNGDLAIAARKAVAYTHERLSFYQSNEKFATDQERSNIVELYQQKVQKIEAAAATLETVRHDLVSLLYAVQGQENYLKALDELHQIDKTIAAITNLTDILRDASIKLQRVQQQMQIPSS